MSPREAERKRRSNDRRFRPGRHQKIFEKGIDKFVFMMYNEGTKKKGTD